MSRIPTSMGRTCHASFHCSQTEYAFWVARYIRREEAERGGLHVVVDVSVGWLQIRLSSAPTGDVWATF